MLEALRLGLQGFLESMGFGVITGGQIIMLLVSFVLLYLAIVKGFEPLLLLPIAFGMLLANLPLAGLMAEPTGTYGEPDFQAGGLLYYLYQGVKLGIYPPLIFMGVGAMTDFGPLIANPRSILGAAAQFGIGRVYRCNIARFYRSGGILHRYHWWAEGPTAIYLTSKLAPHNRSYCHCCLFLYGTCAHYSTAYYEGIDYQGRANDGDGSTATSIQKEKIIFPIMITVVVS